MSRRHRYLAGTAIATVVLVAAAACSSTPSSTATSTTTGTPVKGGTLKIVGEGDVDYMDTADGYYDVTYALFRAIARQLYSYPTTRTPVVDHAGAGHRDRPADDHQRRHGLHDRHQAGVMWDTSPARQVTAQDAVLGFKRLCNSAQPAGAPGYFTDTIAGMAAYCTGFAKVAPTVAAIKAYIDGNNVTGLRRSNPSALQITLTKPAADLPYILACRSPHRPRGVPELSARQPTAGPARRLRRPVHDDQLRADQVDHLGPQPGLESSTDSPRRLRRCDPDHPGSQRDLAQQQIAAGTAHMEWDQNVPTASAAWQQPRTLAGRRPRG